MKINIFDEIENRRKSKRNRQKTECNVIRSKTGCGICGSKDIIIQGVGYCNICGEEESFLCIDYGGYFPRREINLNCDCLKEWRDNKGKIRSYRDIRYIEVKKCIICNSIFSYFCPNCKIIKGWNNSKCWKSAKNQLFCQSCGFRKNC